MRFTLALVHILLRMERILVVLLRYPNIWILGLMCALFRWYSAVIDGDHLRSHVRLLA